MTRGFVVPGSGTEAFLREKLELFTPLKEPVRVEEPELDGFARRGFTVVEWGGKEISAE